MQSAEYALHLMMMIAFEDVFTFLFMLNMIQASDAGERVVKRMRY